MLAQREEYDAVMGVSGGVDSSYAALIAKEEGLRILAVHCDSGWNSEGAVHNIEKLVKTLGVDLVTVVLDWEEVRDLQVAFFKASVANCDIPQNHAFNAAVYKVAREQRIKHIITGGNHATESTLPVSWGHNALDLRHLLGIHRRFGSVKLRMYPKLSFLRTYVWYPRVLGIKRFRILDLIDYNKREAMEALKKEIEWQDYGGKHYESLFTRFFQGCYLPEKFGFDKRRAHLSSLVLSDQLSREQALEEMRKPPYPEGKLDEDRLFFLKKLGLTEEEWNDILKAPIRTYRDYPSSQWLFDLKSWALQGVGQFALPK